MLPLIGITLQIGYVLTRMGQNSFPVIVPTSYQLYIGRYYQLKDTCWGRYLLLVYYITEGIVTSGVVAIIHGTLYTSFHTIRLYKSNAYIIMVSVQLSWC